MDNKNLIVCGCSFTKGHNLPKTESWGGYVAKKLDLNLHNIAIGGMGNEFISNRVISYFLNNEELKNNSVVMIGWSETTRLTGVFENGNGYIERSTIRPQDFLDNEFGIHGRNHWSSDEENYHGYVKKNHKYLRRFFSSFAYCVYKTYFAIHTLKHYLESNNIPYIFFDAINRSKLESIEIVDINKRPLSHRIQYMGINNNILEIEEFVPEWMLDEILNEKIESIIFNDPNFISFNGMSMLSYIFDTNYEYLTEGNPGHPNAIASDLFSDMIIKEYERLYN